ncbi:MAG: WbqC family protein [Nitrospirota bacterium]
MGNVLVVMSRRSSLGMTRRPPTVPSLTICIHQPDFVPYLGFFQRLLLSQHFILLDDVQFIRRGWQHRDRIKGRRGPIWLTLSVRKGDYHQRICDVELSDDPKWIDDNLNLLRDCYRQAPYFAEVFPKVEAVYRGGYRRLIDFNRALLDLAMEYFEIEIPISNSSEYGIEAASSARLLALVQAKQGSVYLTGSGSRDYLDEDMFRMAGIRVIWQEFAHPIYPQLHGDFEPMLSCLDVLFNCGRGAADVVRSTLHA